eukprot:TRINITY_DN21282_c0_g3_i1.p1 TRINITY_DN21282_c0_g3~~TRINITY_DN21282_c0_g3_i1.p1  ORF type:complete len:721 (-),score=130.61 TRINITY_DN21282_c0_g3_i1:100-2262(-)
MAASGSSIAFRRIMAEFRGTRTAMSKKEQPLLMKVEPVNDDLMTWDVHMKLPPESSLQRSLDNLASNLFDEGRDRLFMQIRFPPQYPQKPPEFWVRQPRLKYRSGVPVTFGGRICNKLLTSEHWGPQLRITEVLDAIRESLVEAGAEVDIAVSTVKPGQDYVVRHPQLHRMATENIPSANDFHQPSLRVLSAEDAVAFFGTDLTPLIESDRIALSFDFAQELYGRAERGQVLEQPMMFEIKTATGMKRHCGLFNFMLGLERNQALLPKWVMESIQVENHDTVQVRGVRLPLIQYVKIQPHTAEFYDAVATSGQEAGPLLTESLRKCSALTEDTPVPIEIGDNIFYVQVEQLQPSGAVRIIDTDVTTDFSFKVDFEPAPDLEDEESRAAKAKFLLEKYKAKAEAEKARKELQVGRIEDAKLKRIEVLKTELTSAVNRVWDGAFPDGSNGDVELRLRYPDGTTAMVKFPEGVPAPALMQIALCSEWASKARPWNVILSIPFPPPSRILGLQDKITKDMHRGSIAVREERPPDDAEELLAAADTFQAPDGTVDDAADDLPDVDDSDALNCFDRKFEIQRFIQAGVDPAEAASRYEAGERAELTAAERAPAPAKRLRTTSASQAVPVLERTVSEEQRREDAVRRVVEFTAASADEARAALDTTEWNEERAINNLLLQPPTLDGAVDDEKIQTVMTFTGCSQADARTALEAHGADVNRAVNSIFG